MLLDYKDWLSDAMQLKEGERERVPHWCGEGDVLNLEHTSDGYRSYCFRCHESGFKPHGRQSLNVQLKRWNEADAKLQQETHSRVLQLPYDLCNIFPTEAILWLSRGGITRELISKYGIGYSEHYHRVFIPVYSSSVLVYYQARAVHKGQKPKYINPAVDKGAIRFNSLSDKPQQTVCVTEDILSAIKAGEVENTEGCSILGTSPDPSDVNYLVNFKKIILWFDGDSAGRQCTRILTRQLQLQGRSPISIKSTKDPKEYGRRDIERILKCASLSTESVIDADYLLK